MSQIIISLNPRLLEKNDVVEGSFEIISSSGVKVFFEETKKDELYHVNIDGWDFSVEIDRQSGFVYICVFGIEFFSIFNVWNISGIIKDIAKILADAMLHYIKIGGFELIRDDDNSYYEGDDNKWQD